MYKVEICGVDTSKLARLTNKETNELLKKSGEGDKESRDKLIKGNLRLVLSVMQRFASNSDSPDDLFQVGCIGLMKAIDNFDLSLGLCFSTYGVPMIIGEIRRYLRDNSSIRVSRSIRDAAFRALSAKEQLTIELSREPTISEIAERSGVASEDIVIALEAITAPVSLYDPVYSEGSAGAPTQILDTVSDKMSTTEGWIERIAFDDAVEKLTVRERSILVKRFYLGQTQMDIAEEIGISQAQVSRLEKNAVNKIRKAM